MGKVTGKICAVPGCEEELSEEQVERGMIVCSNCEEAKMHLCESCSKRLSPRRIKNGAVLCQDCESGYYSELNYELEADFSDQRPPAY